MPMRARAVFVGELHHSYIFNMLDTRTQSSTSYTVSASWLLAKVKRTCDNNKVRMLSDPKRRWRYRYWTGGHLIPRGSCNKSLDQSKVHPDLSSLTARIIEARLRIQERDERMTTRLLLILTGRTRRRWSWMSMLLSALSLLASFHVEKAAAQGEFAFGCTCIKIWTYKGKTMRVAGWVATFPFMWVGTELRVYARSSASCSYVNSTVVG